jgi:hypothetical protein
MKWVPESQRPKWVTAGLAHLLQWITQGRPLPLRLNGR